MSQSQELVGARCWYQWSAVGDWRQAQLLFWSTDYGNEGQFPVGVVYDLETQDTHSIYVERITFRDEKPGGEGCETAN